MSNGDSAVWNRAVGGAAHEAVDVAVVDAIERSGGTCSERAAEQRPQHERRRGQPASRHQHCGRGGDEQQNDDSRFSELVVVAQHGEGTAGAAHPVTRARSFAGDASTTAKTVATTNAKNTSAALAARPGTGLHMRGGCCQTTCVSKVFMVSDGTGRYPTTTWNPTITRPK